MSEQENVMNRRNSFKSEWNILRDVHKMLVDAHVLNTPTTTPILDFKSPNELKELIDFSIPDYVDIDPNEVKNICETIIKYSLKTSHPQFHNQLFGGTDAIGLAASWITDALNTSQYTFEVAPVFTIMENEIIHKFCKLFGFENGDGIFTPGGSLSNMYGMVLARYKFNPNIKTNGCFGMKPLVAFTSDQSHYSIQKAAHWLGIGTNNLKIIKSDENGRMLAEDLLEKIKGVLKSGGTPFFVNATAGTTVLGSFDNLNRISDVCGKYELWMHVDSCLGGSIILSQKHKHLLNGIHRADSIAFNPHKSLGVPLQCSMFLVKENGLLHECNSASATYLFQEDKFYDASFDSGDKSIQCGRKVDVFKLWLMLKVRGIAGFEYLINNAMDKTKYLIVQLAKRNGFRLVRKDFQYTNVCFWYIPCILRKKQEDQDWWNKVYQTVAKIKENMIRKGTVMVNYAPLPSKNLGNFFRMTLTCFPPPTETSIDYLINEIERIGENSALN